MVAFPPTGFLSFPHLRACPPPMRVAGSPQLTRPDDLVVCRYGHPDDTPPPPCERLEHGAASPRPQHHDCCCSWRIRRPVACRCGGGVSSLLRGTVARRFGWAGADRCGQSKGKRRKQGQIRLLKGVSRRALHAITRPPASLPFSRALAFPLERCLLTDWLRVCVKGGEVRVCGRGGSV